MDAEAVLRASGIFSGPVTASSSRSGGPSRSPRHHDRHRRSLLHRPGEPRAGREDPRRRPQREPCPHQAPSAPSGVSRTERGSATRPSPVAFRQASLTDQSSRARRGRAPAGRPRYSASSAGCRKNRRHAVPVDRPGGALDIDADPARERQPDRHPAATVAEIQVEVRPGRQERPVAGIPRQDDLRRGRGRARARAGGATSRARPSVRDDPALAGSGRCARLRPAAAPGMKPAGPPPCRPGRHGQCPTREDDGGPRGPSHRCPAHPRANARTEGPRHASWKSYRAASSASSRATPRGASCSASRRDAKAMKLRVLAGSSREVVTM